jgi:MFS family permease
MGLTVDGETKSSDDAEPSVDKDGAAAKEDGYSLREALKTPSLWLIACATFFVAIPASGFGLHVIAFLTDSGLSSLGAAYSWGATLAASICGRIFFGWISEQFQKRYFFATASAVRGFSMLLLVLFSFKMLPPALAIIQLALLYGFGNGCTAVMNPLIIGETFGVRSFGKIMGVIGIPFTIGMAVGQVAAGKFYVMMNDYTSIFVIFAISFMCAGTAISFAKPLFLFKTRESSAQKSA